MSPNGAIRHEVNKSVKTYLEWEPYCKNKFTFVPTDRYGPIEKLIYVISWIRYGAGYDCFRLLGGGQGQGTNRKFENDRFEMRKDKSTGEI